MIDVKELKKMAEGKWLGIFENVGIILPAKLGDHGPCPCCGGTDRFRLDKDTKDGTYYCNGCGPSDGVNLVQKYLGMTLPEAIKRISEILGHVDLDSYKVTNIDDVNKRKEWLINLWKESVPLTGSCMASQYLHGRGISVSPEDVRFCPQCYNSEKQTKLPAMVAAVRDNDGRPVSIHRTYLNGPQKADVEKVKMLMPATAALRGVAIRLSSKFDVVLGVAEGIETALAASQLYDMPVWATVSTSIMESFVPPSGVKRVVIYADNDNNFAGQQSAYRLAYRLNRDGYIVNVEIPSLGDFADEVFHEYRKQLA